MIRRHAFAAAALFALLAGPALAAPGPWSLAPGEYFTELSGGLRSSNSTYDGSGNRLMADGRDEARTLAWTTELGWTKHASFLFSLPLTSVTNQRLSVPSSASRSGLSDVTLGLRWSLANKARAAALQLDWSAPAGYDRRLAPSLGDGRQRLALRLELGSSLGRSAFVQAGAGYLYDYRTIGDRVSYAVTIFGPQPTDWGDHVVADFATAFWLGRAQVAALGSASFETATGRGSTTYEYRVGPRVTYRADARLDVFAGSTSTPAGKNVAHFDEYYAGIAWKLTKLDRVQGFLGGDARP